MGFVTKHFSNNDNLMMLPQPQLIVGEDKFIILVYLYGANDETCKKENIKVEFHDCK